jgi:hypothetical protein
MVSRKVFNVVFSDAPCGKIKDLFIEIQNFLIGGTL